MNATRGMGLALGFVGLLGVVGCGGGSAYSHKAAYGGAYGSPSGAAYGGPVLAAEESASAGADYEAAPAPPPAEPSPGASFDAPTMPRSASIMEGEVARQRPRDEAAERPGLGTEWGESRFSRITTVPFVRANPDTPFASAALFYNDEEGARAMASMAGFARTSGRALPSAGGLLSIGLRDEGGRFLSGFVAGGRNYILGEAGRRYAIVVRNNTDSRLEIMLSVDGLDVIDGRSASFSKRGYLIDPRSEIEIEGFRQSMDSVAAFRFGSVRNSYANQKHGDSRNVGVIGIAVFNERGTSPVPWTPDEVQRRLDANPFPGQFATPPGR